MCLAVRQSRGVGEPPTEVSANSSSESNQEKEQENGVEEVVERAEEEANLDEEETVDEQENFTRNVRMRPVKVKFSWKIKK